MSKPERPFDEELKDLKEKLLEMASRAEEQIGLAVRSLKDREQAMACQVLDREEAINRLDIEVDEMTMRMLALRQPMAADLRFITAAMKISSDLERIGDLAVNIAERTLELLKYPQLKPLIDIPRMTEMVQAMVRDALTAFVNGDAELARDVCRRDDAVDQLNNQVFRELLTYMMEDPETIHPGGRPHPRRPPPRTDRRPRHEHRRGRHLHGQGQDHQAPHRGGPVHRPQGLPAGRRRRPEGAGRPQLIFRIRTSIPFSPLEESDELGRVRVADNGRDRGSPAGRPWRRRRPSRGSSCRGGSWAGTRRRWP